MTHIVLTNHVHKAGVAGDLTRYAAQKVFVGTLG